MGRRKQASKKELPPDPKYHSTAVTRFINLIMERGKRSVAQEILYQAMDMVGEQSKEDPLAVLNKAIENTRPKVEVRSRRIGGATYQVPVEVPSARSLRLAMRWMLEIVRKRKGKPMAEKLAGELMEAYKGAGETIKHRDEVHRMAEANRAFAHYRW